MVKGKIGDQAPDFTLKANTGENITLSQFFGKKNIAFSFIREMKDLLASKKHRLLEMTLTPSKKEMQKLLA